MFQNLILAVLCYLTIASASDYHSSWNTTIKSSDLSQLDQRSKLYSAWLFDGSLEAPKDLVTSYLCERLPDFQRGFMVYQSLIYVNRDLSLLGVYQAGALIYWAPITRGRRISFTPAGEFAVQSKTRLMYSRKYGNVPMPYALHIVGNICIHQGPMPGRPASHGCIRLFRSDALWLYQYARVGTKVIIE